jgi:serine protease Do
MKKYLLSATAVLLLTGTSMAQEGENPDAKPQKAQKQQRDNKRNRNLNEYDEIVIKRKDPQKDTKVTIEIKEDQVIVDGKPIDEFVDEDITVQKRDAKRYNLASPRSPFRFEDGWSADQFELNGGEDRAFLGVTTEGSSEGVRIISVSENSAAAKAGLKKDDIITKVNDKAVFDHEQLSNAIGEYEPEEKVTITYKRDGKENKATATLGRRSQVMGHMPRPPMPPMVFNFDDEQFGDVFQYRNNRPRLGLKVQDTEDGKGVKVIDVDEGSAAEKAGIKENDVITSFEGKEVTSAGELAKASREAKDKSSMKVQLNRNGKPQTIEVKVPKKLKTANL